MAAWGSTQIVLPAWVRQSTGRSSTRLNAAYGYLWWLNRRGVLAGPLIPMSLQRAESPATPRSRLVPAAPGQLYWAIGLGNQIIQVDPASRIVVVRLGMPRVRPTPPTSGSATQYVGTPGPFTLSDPGNTVTGYYYGLFGTSPDVFVAAASDGTAVLALTPYLFADMPLSVQAANGSARSAISTFDITTKLPAGNIASLAWWKLNAAHKTSAADSTGHAHAAALTKDAAITCPATPAPDGYNCSLSVTGKGGQARTAPAILPVVGNNGNFGASVWVRATACASSCVAFSADANTTDEFALGYRKSCTAGGKTGPCWTFSMPVNDSATATVITAASAPGTAKIGRWTQLTGVFFASHGTLLLYVNGVPAGQAAASPWTAPGKGRVRIGNLTPGGTMHDWNGRHPGADAMTVDGAGGVWVVPGTGGASVERLGT